MEYVLSHAKSIKMPLLVQQAGINEVVDAEKSKEFFSNVKSTNKK
jgi:esterase/lipase